MESPYSTGLVAIVDENPKRQKRSTTGSERRWNYCKSIRVLLLWFVPRKAPLTKGKFTFSWTGRLRKSQRDTAIFSIAIHAIWEYARLMNTKTPRKTTNYFGNVTVRISTNRCLWSTISYQPYIDQPRPQIRQADASRLTQSWRSVLHAWSISLLYMTSTTRSNITDCSIRK